MKASLKTNTLKILILFLSFFTLLGLTPQDNTLTEYNGPIEHLTFETLLSNPDRALNQNITNSTMLDESKITPFEFKKILQELYSNNYILISLKELYFIEENIIYFKPIFIPQNKKPLILSFNNVTYKTHQTIPGEIDKIIIDNDNQFATYSTKQNIQNRIAYDNEFLPILEAFIENNPDFSYNNAKGIIFFTINNGILGYDINTKKPSSKHDIKRASEICKRLTLNGWEFGSNGYSYIQEENFNDMEFTKNINLTRNQLSNVTCNTTYYASPTGVNILSQKDKYTILKENNFQVYFENSFKNKFELIDNSLFMSRKEVNGNTLRHNTLEFQHLFDCKKVYDHASRQIPFNEN